VTAPGRTFVVGDVHGERKALDRLLAQLLPRVGPADTLVFLGDYLDRGPDPRGVIERLRRLPRELTGKLVCLRGNHEDEWIASLDEPQTSFLLPPSNGCSTTYRSYVELDPDLTMSDDVFASFVEPATWMPREVAAWLRALPLWYEDAHAIYVHAGLDGDGARWKYPRDGATRPLLWIRDPDFFARYQGKPVVFGHTPVRDLPPEDDTRITPWRRGPLWGIDTGAGRGGVLTAIALPDGEVFHS